ncbi:cellulose binding domain-containing protein [Phytohabitans suffuscus]
MLAGPALGPSTEDRVHRHRLRRHPVRRRLLGAARHRPRGAQRLLGHRHRRPEPASPWLAATRPDVVLMHLGTNDMWGGWIPTDNKITALTKLVGQMRASNPAMKIIVAQIIPMGANACATCPADVVAFNNRIPAWAAGLSTAQSPITVVDQWTGFNTATDTGDGVHPNNAGFQKMADRWYPAVVQALGGGSPPPVTTPPATTPPVTTPPVTTPPVTTPPPAGGTCTATYRVVSQWTGGFQGEVTVRNTGTTARSAWTASFTFGAGQQITQAWNATVTQTGAAVTARNLSWNGNLPAGGTTSFGFLANWTSGNPAPPVTCAVT